jgi:AAA family ATP:ADP antiporter
MILVGSRFTSTEAKRLFGLVGTGGIIGAIAGSGLARGLAEVLATRHLVITAAGFMVVAAAASVPLGRALRARPRTDRSEGSPTVREALAYLRRQPYVARIGLLVLVSTATLTLADYLFKSTVAANIQAASDLGTFFAGF